MYHKLKRGNTYRPGSPENIVYQTYLTVSVRKSPAMVNLHLLRIGELIFRSLLQLSVQPISRPEIWNTARYTFKIFNQWAVDGELRTNLLMPAPVSTITLRDFWIRFITSSMVLYIGSFSRAWSLGGMVNAFSCH